MHRIDGPGATVDNRFTDGDPVGGVQATMVTDDWANDVQEEIMSVLTAAAIAPVKGTQNQLLKAIRSVNTGLVGAASNVKMTVNVASASATLTADEIVVGTALGGQTYRLSGFNKSINLATTGAGGMDAGPAPVSGWVALYAIYNSTTGASALLATNATLAILPPVYSAAPYPVGYSASALVAVLRTNASGQFAVQSLVGREVFYFNQVYSGGGSGAFVALSIAASVPPNAKVFQANVAITASTSGVPSVALCATSAGAGTPGYATFAGYNPGGVVIGCSFRDLPIFTPQTVYLATSGVVSTYVINSYGYNF
jgi:hypothetical protein